MRPEPVAAGLEIAPQVAVVVDLAVEDDPDRLVFVGHRLLAAGPVDDGQPAMTKRKPGRAMNGAAVRTAMMQALGHRANRARYIRRADLRPG